MYIIYNICIYHAWCPFIYSDNKAVLQSAAVILSSSHGPFYPISIYSFLTELNLENKNFDTAETVILSYCLI